MATAATAAETGARGAGGAGRSHPEAEMMAAAGGSHGTPVKLCVTNVYDSTSSEVVSLETTSTIGDLKRLLQETFSSRPAPSQQRLIFRGKQCEESQQLGHVLRGLDLSGQHNVHLIVSPPVEQPVPPSTSFTNDGSSGSTMAGRTPEAQPSTSTSISPPQRPPQPQPQPRSTGESSVRSSGAAPVPPAGVHARATGNASATASSTVAYSPTSQVGKSERIQLNQMQLEQLQWQYQRALKENEEAIEAHRQRSSFLSAQSRALRQQHQQQPHHVPSTSSTAYRPTPHDELQRQRQRHIAHLEHPQHLEHPEPNEQEVSVRAATRALGGNMPGPAAGGGVRDITGPPPAGQIPAAGLGEDGDAGRGNLVDPPPRAPDIGREARGYLKMVLQCLGVTLVFGIEADGWVVGLLALCGFVAFLFRTGLLKEMLGSGREGGGLWKKLCTGATVITEDGGLLMDLRFLCSAFFFSLFPKWQPVRSPEAIAAEAAAQAQARAAQAHAAGVRAGQRAQALAAPEAAATGEATSGEPREPNAAPAEQAADPEPAAEVAGVPVVQGERGGGGSGVANGTMAAAQRERAADVNPGLPD
eukprot:g5735.t1